MVLLRKSSWKADSGKSDPFFALQGLQITSPFRESTSFTRELLRAVCRGYCHRHNEVCIQGRRQVLLIAIEALALALPAVTHLPVLDGNAAIFRDALAEADSAAWVWIEILPAN